MIYKGYRNGVHLFISGLNEIEIKDSDCTESEFEEIYEEVKLFGRTKVKRPKRGLMFVEKIAPK